MGWFKLYVRVSTLLGFSCLDNGLLHLIYKDIFLFIFIIIKMKIESKFLSIYLKPTTGHRSILNINFISINTFLEEQYH